MRPQILVWCASLLTLFTEAMNGSVPFLISFYDSIFVFFLAYSYLCSQEPKHVRIMTAIEMNAELFRQLSIIAEDEGLMAKMLKYAKKLAAKKEKMDETEYLMSSPAMTEVIRQGQEDIKNGRGEVVKVEDLWK